MNQPAVKIWDMSILAQGLIGVLTFCVAVWIVFDMVALWRHRSVMVAPADRRIADKRIRRMVWTDIGFILLLMALFDGRL